MPTCIKCRAKFEPPSESPSQLICQKCKLKFQMKHERIKCEVCGRMFVSLKPHLRMHKMTANEYRITYPGKPITSSTLRDAIVHGVPKMPPVNFCVKCGTRFPANAPSKSVCQKCSEDKSEGGVECQVCHEKFKWITQAHLNSHGVSLADYKQRFPGSPTYDQDVAQKFQARDEANRSDASLLETRRRQISERFGSKATVEGGVLLHGRFAEKMLKSEDAMAAYEFWLSTVRRGLVPLPFTEKDFRTFNALEGFDLDGVSMMLFKMKWLPLMRKAIG